LIEDEEFWNILAFDNWVLFQSLERIYIYDILSKSVKIVAAKSTKAHMFNLNKSIYYQSIGQGLFKIENGLSILISEHPIIKEAVVSGIFSIRDKTVIVSEKGEFYFLDEGELIQWNIPLKDELDSIKVYSSLQLADGSIVLGTISDGIYHLDSNGVTIQKINQKRGLNNNTVLSIFEDVEHNLWLGLDNGISVVNMDSPFAEYIDKNGELGVIYASTIFNDDLYLGTNQGLFHKKVDSDKNFNFIEGTEGQVWTLKVIDKVLFCGHNNGTYLIENATAKLIADFPGTWDIKKIPNQENYLLQGNYNGLSILSKMNEKWVLRNKIDGFDISSRFFEFIDAKRVAVNRENKGIFLLDLDQDLTHVIHSKNQSSEGFGASLARYSNDVLYTTVNGVFKYENKKDRFVADTLLTNLIYKDDDKPIGIFVSDTQENRLWGFTKSNIIYVTPGNFDNKSEINKIAIPIKVRKNLGVLGFEHLTRVGNEKYLVGTSNGFLTVDLKKLTTKKHAIQINSVSQKSKNSTIKKIARDSSATFDFSKNNLFFEYNVPEFDKYTEVNYQYQLKGIYDAWSEWTNVSNVSFENLPFGSYTFNVRAKIGNDVSANVATYDFSIRRPWYFSNLMIILYLLLLGFVAFLVHKLYKGYYRKQQEKLLKENRKKIKRKKLKAQKKIVQLNNEKLREEVENKNRELAISTMSIIKKNEFLNAIKDQLKGAGENSHVKTVIRTIDRNINNSDDWKFFEDAFNNADKDFLKKVKTIHPELTSNDLKLCAYLRLNLSSKEIAPLLNISVRSVEVKRYRLRKKLNLPHEEGLTDYIMEI